MGFVGIIIVGLMLLGVGVCACLFLYVNLNS